MPADVGPGTLLVCISNGNGSKIGDYYDLTVGAIYTVAEIIPFDPKSKLVCCECGERCRPFTLRQKLKPHDALLVVYCITLFRPLNDGDTSLVSAEEEIEDVIVIFNLEPAQ